MKPVFKCDYCSKMGTEEEIREHEPKCIENYDRKSCYTCVHRKISCIHNIKENNKTFVYECKADKEIPKGNIIEFCSQYERKEMPNDLVGLFGNLFG